MNLFHLFIFGNVSQKAEFIRSLFSESMLKVTFRLFELTPINMYRANASMLQFTLESIMPNNFFYTVKQRPDSRHGLLRQAETVLFHARQRLAWLPPGTSPSPPGANAMSERNY